MASADLDLDKVLAHIRKGQHVDERCALAIVRKLMEVLYNEPSVLRLNAPLTVCGDLHGQLFDLFRMFEITASPADRVFLFLGDYVDRGYYSMETFLYVAALKLKYPRQVWMLRGNHESRSVSQSYGFYDETVASYGHGGVWSVCCECFDLLPMCALIGGKIFATHGGLSPDVPLVESVELLDRQTELLMQGPLADLAWSDPVEQPDPWRMSPRGGGWTFSERPSREFMQNNALQVIVRAHELAPDGFFWRHDERVLTVWGAPNYGYRTKNAASVYVIDEALRGQIKVYEAMPDSRRHKPEDFVPLYFV